VILLVGAVSILSSIICFIFPGTRVSAYQIILYCIAGSYVVGLLIWWIRSIIRRAKLCGRE
jgi:hypothetical protein